MIKYNKHLGYVKAYYVESESFELIICSSKCECSQDFKGI